MAAPRRQRHGHGHMTLESSSSSDEEEKQRLLSSVWQPLNESSRNVSQNATVLPSKREDASKSFNMTNDYRVAETTPEYKSFVAKKLTASLDKFLADKEAENRSWQSRMKLPDDDDSFKLFSTSSATYEAPKENLPQAPWKRKRKKKRRVDDESRTSSDSDEERLRLEAASVSADFILRGARAPPDVKNGDVEEERGNPPQVTLNPVTSVLTNNTSSLEEQEARNTKKNKKNKKKSKHKKVDSLNNVSENLTTLEETSEKTKDKLEKVQKMTSKEDNDIVVNPLPDTVESPPKVNAESEGGQQEASANCKSSKVKKKKRKREERNSEVSSH